jgi:hypothetical protein
MSRSPINWDKARRDERVRTSRGLSNLDEALQEGIPGKLHKKLEGIKLKPFVVDYVQRPELDPKIWQLVIGLISRANIEIISRESRNDGTIWCECEMQLRTNQGACVESEEFQFLLKELAERHELIGQNWILYFWFRCPQTLL